VSHPLARPITSWTISIRGLEPFSASTLRAKREASFAAVSAPRLWRMGTMSLSMVLGSPTTVSSEPWVRRYAARWAAAVLVSSPPMVWSTSTPSACRRAAATASADSSGPIRPRWRQSASLVSFTRLLPIGLPPKRWSTAAPARSSGPITTWLPVSNPW